MKDAQMKHVSVSTDRNKPVKLVIDLVDGRRLFLNASPCFAKTLAETLVKAALNSNPDDKCGHEHILRQSDSLSWDPALGEEPGTGN